MLFHEPSEHVCAACSKQFSRADLLIRHQKALYSGCRGGQESLNKKAGMGPSDTLLQRVEECLPETEIEPANIPNMLRTPSPVLFYDASCSGSSVAGHSDSPLASVDETMPTTISQGTLQPKPEHLTVKSCQRMTQTTSFTEHDIGSVVSIDEDINSIADSLDMSERRTTAVKYLAKSFLEDVELQALYREMHDHIGDEKSVRNHRRILKRYFLAGLSYAQTRSQRYAFDFLRSRRRRTELSNTIFQLVTPEDYQFNIELDQEVDKLSLIEKFLASHSDGVPESFIGGHPEASDNDSDVEINGTTVFNHIQAAAGFFTSGPHFQSYKTELRRFVRGLPSSTDEFREAITRRSIQKAQLLLETEGFAICRKEYEYLDELSDLGYSAKEIAEALIQEKDPWIYFGRPILPSKIDVALHQPGCVHLCTHYGGFHSSREEKAVASLTYEPLAIDNDTVKHMVAKMCGIAGIIPVSADMKEWSGEVKLRDDEEPSAAAVGYVSVKSNGYILWDETARQIEYALDGLVSLFGWLQGHGLCCNSYTVLVAKEEDAVVEVMSVSLSLVKRLQTAGAASHHCLQTNRTSQFEDIYGASLAVLSLVCPADQLSLLANNSEDTTGAILQLFGLSVQFLCLGMLSYSQAHTGGLNPFFLDRRLTEICLHGISGISPGLCLVMKLHELNCMGQMLGDRVMGFTWNKKGPEKHNLLVHPEDLLDTWGPGRLITKGLSTEQQLYGIAVGNGLIQRHSATSELLHWENDSSFQDYTLSEYTFSGRKKVMIGGRTTINMACPTSQTPLIINPSDPHDFLGATRDRWAVIQRQLGGQVGANYGLITANLTWSKIDGVTLKDLYRLRNGENISIAFLEAPWGVQLSLCTGVAQRVPLREVVADVLRPMIEGEPPLPQGWDELLLTHNAIENLRSADFRGWATSLPETMQQVLAHAVHRVLVALHNTGFDKDTEELIVACALSEDPFRSFRISCKGHHVWAKILKDSARCATFACVSTKCLQTRTRRCRGQATPLFPRAPALLATAVCQIEEREEQLQIIVGELRAGIDYWFGEFLPDLKAKLVRSDPTVMPAEVRLQVEISRVPIRLLQRLHARRPIPRLQERQSAMEISANEVLLLDKI